VFLTADLIDAHEAVLQFCDLQFRDFGGRTRFHGAIRTVACRENNVLVRATLSQLGHGGVRSRPAGRLRRCDLQAGGYLYADEDGIVVSEQALEIAANV
jgi:regulator of ribonuclease activity A